MAPPHGLEGVEGREFWPHLLQEIFWGHRVRRFALIPQKVLREKIFVQSWRRVVLLRLNERGWSSRGAGGMASGHGVSLCGGPALGSGTLGAGGRGWVGSTTGRKAAARAYAHMVATAYPFEAGSAKEVPSRPVGESASVATRFPSPTASNGPSGRLEMAWEI